MVETAVWSIILDDAEEVCTLIGGTSEVSVVFEVEEEGVVVVLLFLN